jgi:hypothetical protein
MGRAAQVIRGVARWAVEPRTAVAPGMLQYLLAAGLFLVGTALCYLRIPPGSRNLLWAEDGSVFLTQAYQGLPFGGLFEPYAGYLHFAPRIGVGIVASVVPLDVVPVAIALVASAATAFLASAVFLLLRARIPATAPRLIVWVAIALSSVAGIEVNGSLANTHWYLMVALFVALAVKQSQLGLMILAAVIAALAILSDPLGAIFAPLAVAQLVSLRRKRDLVVPLVYFGALVVQLIGVFNTQRVDTGFDPSPLDIVRTYGFRVVLTSVFGPFWASDVVRAGGLVAVVVAIVVMLIVLAVRFWRAHRDSGLIPEAVVASFVFFAISATVRWFPELDPTVGVDWGGSRYSVVPICLLIIAIAEAIAPREGSRHSVPSKAVALAVVAGLVVTTWVGWGISGRFGPVPWTSALEEADTRCAVTPHATIEIPVAPESFLLAISCEQVLSE